MRYFYYSLYRLGLWEHQGFDLDMDPSWELLFISDDKRIKKKSLPSCHAHSRQLHAKTERRGRKLNNCYCCPCSDTASLCRRTDQFSLVSRQLTNSCETRVGTNNPVTHDAYLYLNIYAHWQYAVDAQWLWHLRLNWRRTCLSIK